MKERKREGKTRRELKIRIERVRKERNLLKLREKMRSRDKKIKKFKEWFVEIK